MGWKSDWVGVVVGVGLGSDWVGGGLGWVGSGLNWVGDGLG